MRLNKPSGAEKHAMEVDSPIGIPKQFDEGEGATPFPRENQIFVAVENIDIEDISLGLWLERKYNLS
jgi:hypothetical protein